MSRARELSRLGNPNIVKATDAYNVGFGTEVPLDPASSTTVISAGIVSATKFFGDGAGLEGVASAGLGTAIGDTAVLDALFYTNSVLSVNTGVTTVNIPTTGNVGFTPYSEVDVESGSELVIDDGDEFVVNILGIASIRDATSGSGGILRADGWTAKNGGAPTAQNGLVVTGVCTADTFSATTGTFSGNVSIGGTLTYEDVKNVDSVGIVTAGKGLRVTTGGIVVTAGISTFDATIQAGIVTGATYYGDGTNLTGVGTDFINSASITVSGIATVSGGTNLDGWKVEEGNNDTSTALNGEFDFKLEDGHIQRFTTATGGNYFPDFKVSSSKTLASVMDTGDVVTCTLIVASSSHYCTTGIKIDDSTTNVDLDWVGGSAPDAANGSGYDVYSFTIIKTAATPAYHIIGNALGAA